MTATKAHSYWQRTASIAPLVTFRIAFGLLMFASLLRFLLRGWVDTLYVQPSFHFTYWGFEWVKPLPPAAMYAVFVIILLSALFIAIGFCYRWAATLFFIGFTYVELIDLTTYLNHYYFVSLVAFMMIWLPANRCYSVDVWMHPHKRKDLTPVWTIHILQFQLAVVYVFAGIAKLNTDWLLHAEPMKTWLPARSHLPVVGPYMYKDWVAYLFSWFGAMYDCFIVFFLLNKHTRPWAYAVVLGFHIATAIFFPGIGMFPYVMIVATLIFFSPTFHERILPFYKAQHEAIYTFRRQRMIKAMIAVYVVLQLLIPMRYLFYPDKLFWTEEGYRFSWRVMLMEKAGAAYFTVRDAAHQQYTTVDNKVYLTPLQEKMMSTQPDLLLKYAHFLHRTYAQKGWRDPEVYAEVYVSLNGERSRLFIDSTVNLAAQPISWKHYQWIIPYK